MNLLLAITSTILGLAPLHEAGFRGEGITIAVIDGGFFRADEIEQMPTEQIIGAYNLIYEDWLQGDSCVSDTTKSLFTDVNNAHGTMCLSTMLYRDSSFCGTAPDAQYILIKSEDYYTEYISEAERLADAFYLADSLGADIVSVSLGYSEFDDPSTNYRYEDMDGSTVASQAALALARKGVLVCVSAGNSGNKPWHYITPPADADSILTVGAVTEDGSAAVFSSYGPTYDLRIKPEVASWGQKTRVFNPTITDSIGNYVGGISTSNGTSFSCPQVAGMAACLWQAMPTLSAMQLRQLIIESTHNYPYADAQRGYGVPDAWYAYTGVRRPEESTDVEDVTGCVDNHEKRLEGTRIVIIRDGIRYDVLGRPID
ncbi:MAG: S8 family serine peptidase [Paludibacteraceae bacterium]|nr:S8 family serine peptidase [Paludibacteraceae bacterium]